MHAENTSTRQVEAFRLYHSQRSRLLFARAHWSRGQALALLALTFTLEPVARLVKAGLERDPRAAAATLAASRRLAGELLRSGRPTGHGGGK